MSMDLIAGREPSRRAHIPDAALCDVPKPIPHMRILVQSIVTVHARLPCTVCRARKNPTIDVCREPSDLFQEHVVSHRFKVRKRTAEDGLEEVGILWGGLVIFTLTVVTCSFPERRTLTTWTTYSRGAEPR
jgi:hypothetical protein